MPYLLIGNFTQDTNADSWCVGGTAYYGGSLACVLGYKVHVISRHQQGLLDKANLPSAFTIQTLSSDRSITFANTYDELGRRRQMARNVPAPFPPNFEIPDINPEICHYAPILNEYSSNLVGKFRGTRLTCVTAQGLLRTLRPNGAVERIEDVAAINFESRLDVAVLSAEDTGNSSAIHQKMIQSSDVFILTQGPDGAILFENGRKTHFPVPRKVKAGFLTGAGDNFSTALFHLLAQGKPIGASIEFAHRVAGMFIAQGPAAYESIRQLGMRSLGV